MTNATCMICKQDMSTQNPGIEIKNFCLDNLPSEIHVCKLCAEKIAIGFMTGKINPLKLFNEIRKAQK